MIRNWRMVKIATTKAQRKLFFNLRSMKKGLAWLSQEEADDIAKELNVSTKDVFEMESRLQGQDITFEADDDDDSPFAPSAWLTADDSQDPAESTEQHEQQLLMSKRLSIALEKLDTRSREILTARWLSEDKKATLQTLADRYNISAERIRQIEQQAMETIRLEMADLIH